MRTERRGMHGWVTLPTIERTQTTKRLKHCFTNPAHVWANPLQKDGSGYANTSAWNSIKNWYFKTSSDGTRVMYSYRDSYVIASRFEHKGKIVFLLREGKGYGVTTSQQMSATRAAVPKDVRGVEVFTVSNMVSYYDHTKPGAKEHASNVQAYIANIKSEIEESTRARSSWRITSARGRAAALLTGLKRYAKVFGLRLPNLPRVPKLDPVKMAQILAKEKVRADAKAERRRLQHEAWEAAHKAEVEAWLASPKACKHLGTDGQPQHSFSRRYECESQQEQEEWDANKAQLIERWRNGEDVTLSSRFAYREPVVLRVKDGKVETSQHAEVEILGLAGAARLWRFLKALKDAGRTYQRNGHSERIGHFVLESFNGKEVHVGCHHISWEECERIAPQVLVYEAERGDVQVEE